MFWRTCIALLLLISLFFIDLFFLFSIFFFLPFVCCVIPSNFLPSSLSLSRALFFFFQLSEILFSSTKDSKACIPVCTSYIPWLRLFLCFITLLLLHLIPVFLSNISAVFAFYFFHLCVNTHMKNFLLWQEVSLSSSCPWLLLLTSAMDFWGKTSGLACRKCFLGKRCETVRAGQCVIVIRHSKEGCDQTHERKGLCRKEFLWDLSDIKQIERGCLTEQEVFWDLIQLLLSVIQKYLDCISKYKQYCLFLKIRHVLGTKRKTYVVHKI